MSLVALAVSANLYALRSTEIYLRPQYTNPLEAFCFFSFFLFFFAFEPMYQQLIICATMRQNYPFVAVNFAAIEIYLKPGSSDGM